MTSPTSHVVQMTYTNPDASAGMIIPVAVVPNTDQEQVNRNIALNSRHPLEWIKPAEPHDRIAVIVGGGPSLEKYGRYLVDLPEDHAADVFALNGASRYLTELGARVDYQVIADAKLETATLVDIHAKNYIFASQVHPDTLCHAILNKVKPADRVRLWHLNTPDVETFLPDHRRQGGGYALLGGGYSVGIGAIVLAYAMGYRKMHLVGYDSSHSDVGDSHAYCQHMNASVPCVDVKWGDKTYLTSVTMKGQAERFQMLAPQLEKLGVKFSVFGEGLLQAMWRSRGAEMTEADKYRAMWRFDIYREVSNGLLVAPMAMQWLDAPLGSTITSYGCGTGRPALYMKERGWNVSLIDIADNCRDEEAMGLPFLCWDLRDTIPLWTTYGFCSDVMEHIPTDSVSNVIKNIMDSSERVFFQISTRPCEFGRVIGANLHLTVWPHERWKKLFETMGYEIVKEHETEDTSCFLVVN